MNLILNSKYLMDFPRHVIKMMQLPISSKILLVRNLLIFFIFVVDTRNKKVHLLMHNNCFQHRSTVPSDINKHFSFQLHYNEECT